MKKRLSVFGSQFSVCAVLLVLFAGVPRSVAQIAPPWDLAVYQEYFESHAELTAAELLAEYATGAFAKTAPTDFVGSAYGSDIQTIFELTPDEIALIERHGFVVSERMTYPSFGHALYDVFVNDMPVYVSSDAILHALHMSYDDILKDVEYTVLVPQVGALLTSLHGQLAVLANQYSSTPEMAQALRDVDLFLTIPRRLLGQSADLLYEENRDMMNALLNGIDEARPVNIALFAETARDVDLSQFKPRGHYTDDIVLERYFKAMMWLGRIELYLIGPKNTLYPPSEADVQRQAIMASLISELAELSGSKPVLDRIDLILRTMVGESDNVTLDNLRHVLDEVSVDEASDLLDNRTLISFQERLAEKPFAFQRILSQILISGSQTEPIVPAASFFLLGQRFIIDSYVTGSLVYNQIYYQGDPVYRMMPSTLDILFALGNDGAAQFLEEELERYHYARYLASLRHLIDSYDASFWSASMYNGWLNAIRQLSPPSDREQMPPFMQTAAWWQKQMNTQLASWAQLRHDNLLYAKPSYTGGVVCLFPESYVEPIPEFFEALGAFARRAAAQMDEVLPTGTTSEQYLKDRVVAYFENLSTTTDTLASIAQKELDGNPISEHERVFLGDMLQVMQEYAFKYVAGWYPRLFYQQENQFFDENEFQATGRIFDEDLVVADVHTQPTDEFGARVGKVLHAGTGLPNMAVIVASLPGGQETSFIGPVMSYYEHTTLDFRRLTDEEWASMYNEAPSFRPVFTNPYMADHAGSAIPGGLSLVTGVERDPANTDLPAEALLTENYPNPFNESALIRFSVPHSTGIAPVTLRVFNSTGQLLATLVDEPLMPGHYTARWDGTTADGLNVSSGVYSYLVTVGERRSAGMMIKVR